MTGDWYSRTYPDSPLDEGQRRCLLVLQEWQRLYNIRRFGEFRSDGGFQPCANGIEVHLGGRQALSTHDDDGLTRLVLGAHRYCCRVEISMAGRHIVIRVHPRQQGLTDTWRGHPTLADLASRADRSEQEGSSDGSR